MLRGVKDHHAFIEKVSRLLFPWPSYVSLHDATAEIIGGGYKAEVKLSFCSPETFFLVEVYQKARKEAGLLFVLPRNAEEEEIKRIFEPFRRTLDEVQRSD